MLLLLFLLPLPSRVSHPENRAPIRVLDRHGKLLYEARQEDFGMQEELTLADLHPLTVPALIAVEDRTFRSHLGVSVRGITRALWQNLNAGRIVSGGSTLTQQLVRIRLQPPRRSLLYKMREAWLGLKLDARLSKDEILQQYLQSVYFGHQAYGIRSAATVYFGKKPQELSISELALLIGLIQSPVSLDPFVNPNAALARRSRVLTAMAEEKVITADEQATAEAEELQLTEDRTRIAAPHFVFWLLSRYADRARPGAALRTTLDADLQTQLEAIVERRVAALADKNVTGASVIVLDAHTGELLGMVGSQDYFDATRDGAVNVAVSPRQPGSSLKPFTYALALQRGDTAATTVADVFVQLLTEEGNPYTPRNYDYDFHGLVRYREALANSYNIAAVKVLEKVGVQTLLDFLRTAGITTLNREPEFYGLALTLGSGEVKLLELAQAYGIFPRGGRTLSVLGLLDEQVMPSRKILDERVAWLITDILSDPVARLPEFGEATPLAVPPYNVAAKTGTTRNARDNWAIGYTPDRIVGVWVGNADNTPMKGTSGITGAGPIFHDVMEVAMAGLPVREFARPAGTTEQTICRLSGKLPSSLCPQTINEYFLAGTEPKEIDDLYVELPIDMRNSRKATDDCPPKFVRNEVFTIFPPELRQWAREHGYTEPPSAYSDLCGDVPTSDFSQSDDQLTITEPQPHAEYLLDPLVPDESEQIWLEARAPQSIQTVEWSVDGQVIGSAAAPDFRLAWPPQPGRHRIAAKTGTAQATVEIQVLKP